MSKQAHPDHVHRAVLAGLLSHIGMRDSDGRQFRGARDSRFVIAPGSVLTRRPARWVMAAELVETNQLWARRVATIQPEWAERLAGHLVKRSYSEPWWDSRQGRAVIAETVTLYGLPIVANRTIGLDRVDSGLARRKFIRHALVGNEWEARHEFVATNRRFVERVRMLEARIRRRDLLDDDALFEFYDERLPADAVSARHFDRWWRDARRHHAELLDLTPDVLATGRVSTSPATPTRGGMASWNLPSNTATHPTRRSTAPRCAVPLTLLNQVTTEGLDWGIPGYRHELASMLVRSLPKEIRRDLIPLNETATAAVAALPFEPSPGALVHGGAGLSRDGDQRNPVDAGQFDIARVPAHLRLHVVVVDEKGSPSRCRRRPRCHPRPPGGERPLGSGEHRIARRAA